MENTNAPVYDRNTIEFVTVALEFCTFIEKSGELSLYEFADKSVKLLPLLYLKATLLPDAETDNEPDPEQTVTEDMYEGIRTRLSNLLGEYDVYLETFHQDMQYSDTPIAATISENLADVYQDTGNFVSTFRQGNEEAMLEAIALCRENFRTYWGGQLLNALKALHNIRYSEEIRIDTNDKA